MAVIPDVDRIPPYIRERRRFIRSVIIGDLFNNHTFAVVGRVFLQMIIVEVPCIIDRLIYQVGNVSAGNARMGLYREGATVDSPDGGELVVESASVAQPVGGGYSFLTIIATRLARGKYWLAIQGDDVTGTFRGVVCNAQQIAFLYDHVYGPFTDPCPAVALASKHLDGSVRVVL